MPVARSLDSEEYNKRVSPEEEALVNKVLNQLDNYEAAIWYLHGRGWTMDLICAKLDDEDGKPLEINQVEGVLSTPIPHRSNS